MTKPLTIFLELVGGAILIAGLLKYSLILSFIGALVFISGAIGHRRRMAHEKATR